MIFLQEGSLDSGASTEAKVGDADLPELEDYWCVVCLSSRCSLFEVYKFTENSVLSVARRVVDAVRISRI